jgi:hypothetical protein
VDKGLLLVLLFFIIITIIKIVYYTARSIIKLNFIHSFIYCCNCCKITLVLYDLVVTLGLRLPAVVNECK